MGRGLGSELDPREGQSDEGGEGLREGKSLLGRLRGFDPLKGISKYITFKGLKGRNLLKRRIFIFFIKPLKGFYKKGKKSSFKKRPREGGLGG